MISNITAYTLTKDQLHPVKAATSFECDGCNHHASFHSLENPTEDAIIARWGAQEAENRIERQAIAGANKKRKRIADKPANEEEILGLPGVFEIVDGDDTEETVEEKVVMVAEVKKGSATGRARNGIGIGVRKARGGGTATTLRGRKT